MSESSGGMAQEPESGEPVQGLWIPQALEEISRVLSSKNADYRLGGEFSNFEFAAQVAGTTPAHAILTQVGIKVGRLIGLLQSGDGPNNESIADTIKDLHGYAAILHAWSLMSESEK